MKNKIILLFALLLLLGIQLLTPDTASACPTCKDGLSNGIAMGYAISILMMMGMPFVIFGFWVVTIFRLRSKAMVEVRQSNAMPRNACV